MGIYYLFILSKRTKWERGLFQKTFSKSKREMQLCLRLDRIAEPPRRLPEPKPERNNTVSQRNISMSTAPPMLPWSRPEETPKPPVASSLKPSQRLHSLSELRVSTSLPQSQRRS